VISVDAGERARQRRWFVSGRSVRGRQHAANDVPLQDAIAFAPHCGPSVAAVLAISDGHGSPKCFRSDIGARIACQTALETFARLAHSTSSGARFPKLDAGAHRRLTGAWRERVQRDLDRVPFTDSELHALDAPGRSAREAVLCNPYLAYGATLLAVVVTAVYAAYLQIGDGDLLVRSSQGRTRRIFPRDDSFAATETKSLCSPQAWRDIRSCVQPHDDAPPALILACTDGYANSFGTDADFLQIAQDYEHLIAVEGFEPVADALEQYLDDTSTEGSGDDITLGVIAFAGASSIARASHDTLQPLASGRTA